jgi:quercetin dioxygenase-like cupin family protein
MDGTVEVEVGEINHFFADGPDGTITVAKQMFLPQGYRAVSHKHKYDHLSILAQGSASVSLGAGPGAIRRMYTAPAVVTIEAGAEHEIYAFSDAVWYCIHAVKDKENNDKVLIEE